MNNHITKLKDQLLQDYLYVGLKITTLDEEISMRDSSENRQLKFKK